MKTSARRNARPTFSLVFGSTGERGVRGGLDRHDLVGEPSSSGRTPEDGRGRVRDDRRRGGIRAPGRDPEQRYPLDRCPGELTSDTLAADPFLAARAAIRIRQRARLDDLHIGLGEALGRLERREGVARDRCPLLDANQRRRFVDALLPGRRIPRAGDARRSEHDDEELVAPQRPIDVSRGHGS